jgi:hypothetical protein
VTTKGQLSDRVIIAIERQIERSYPEVLSYAIIVSAAEYPIVRTGVRRGEHHAYQ